MDIGHVPVFMLGLRMFMHVRVRFSSWLIGLFVAMEFIGPGMSVFVCNRHMSMNMDMFFICQ